MKKYDWDIHSFIVCCLEEWQYNRRESVNEEVRLGQDGGGL